MGCLKREAGQEVGGGDGVGPVLRGFIYWRGRGGVDGKGREVEGVGLLRFEEVAARGEVGEGKIW